MTDTHASDTFAQTFAEDVVRHLPASPALAGLVAKLRSAPKAARAADRDMAEARRAFDAYVAAGLRANGIDETIADGVRIEQVDADGVPLVVAVPSAAATGSLLHIHGGGWQVGSAQALAPALADWAAKTGAVVASVEYRLAPEHRHPAAADDCERAARWWLGNAPVRYGVDRCVLLGESAGAQLGVLTLLRLREAGLAFAGAMLAYGLYDFTNTLPSRTVADEGAFLVDSRSCASYPAICFDGQIDVADARVSPLRAPPEAFAGLPPTLFAVGTMDPLLDDSVLMHERWRRAGSDAWLAVYEAAPHAFDLLPVPEAAHFSALRTAFVRHCLR